MLVDWMLVLRNGALLAGGAALLIVAALRLNPRLFMGDFPEEVRSRMPPKTAGESVASVILGLLLIGWIVGLMIRAALQAEAAGAPRPLAIGLHAFFCGMVFNLTDWLLIDELWLGVLRPRWLYPPGVTASDAPHEHFKHFADFLKGTVMMAVLGGLIALGVSFF